MSMMEDALKSATDTKECVVALARRKARRPCSARCSRRRGRLSWWKIRAHGKPSPMLLTPVPAEFAPDEIAIVGDRLYTDKAMADNAHVDFVCVLVETFDKVETTGK